MSVRLCREPGLFLVQNYTTRPKTPTGAAEPVKLPCAVGHNTPCFTELAAFGRAQGRSDEAFPTPGAPARPDTQDGATISVSPTLGLHARDPHPRGRCPEHCCVQWRC